MRVISSCCSLQHKRWESPGSVGGPGSPGRFFPHPNDSGGAVMEAPPALRPDSAGAHSPPLPPKSPSESSPFLIG